MLYQYRCKSCAIDYDVVQKVSQDHNFTCPECEGECGRVFTVPSVKKNEGFFSATLGRHVDSQTDFEQGLQQVRYETDQSKWVGDNSKPKDEWVENKENYWSNRKERVAKRLEYSQETQYGAQRK